MVNQQVLTIFMHCEMDITLFTDTQSQFVF